MNKSSHFTSLAAVAAAACILAQQAVATPSVWLEVPVQEATQLPDPGPFAWELMIDFTNEMTKGGGVDFALTGAASALSFTPSAYFVAKRTAEPLFWAYGTEHADADYQVNFASFNGIEGKHDLGTFTVTPGQPLVAGQFIRITTSINTWYGDFIAPNTSVQQVTLGGALITTVPEPQAWAMLLVGMGAVGIGARRRQSAG